MDYKIYAPKYISYSAGVRVLYKLNDELNNAGYKSDIVLFGEDIEYKNVIAIYPEITKGNPLNANKVVRYVLYYPGGLNGDKVYSNNELVFYYCDEYKESIKNKISGKLFTPCYDLNLFKDLGLERDSICYWHGKATQASMPLKKEYIEITRHNPSSREKLARLFNRCNYTICCDNNSAIVQESILCNTPVVLVNGFENYKNTEFGINGVCDCVENIHKAKETMHKVRDVCYKLEDEFKQQLQSFIEVTQR